MQSDRVVKLITDSGLCVESYESILSPSSFVSEYAQNSDEEELIFKVKDFKKSTLEGVIEFCKNYAVEKMKEIPKPLHTTDLSTVIQQVYADFIDKTDNEIYDIIMAANFLDIPPLLELGCAKIATFIKGKTSDEIRKLLNIENDFTPEEEAEIKEQNKWCEEL